MQNKNQPPIPHGEQEPGWVELTAPRPDGSDFEQHQAWYGLMREESDALQAPPVSFSDEHGAFGTAGRPEASVVIVSGNERGSRGRNRGIGHTALLAPKIDRDDSRHEVITATDGQDRIELAKSLVREAPFHLDLSGAENKRKVEVIDEILRGRINVSLWADTPLLTRAEVKSRLGLGKLGSLLAVIDLPENQSVTHSEQERRTLDDRLKVYCFSGTDGRPVIMGGRELQQLQMYGHDRDGYMKQPRLAHAALLLRKGSKLNIGRSHWLPGLGSEVDLIKSDGELRRTFESVSHNHAAVEVNDRNELIINLASTKNGIEVEHGSRPPAAHAGQQRLPLSEAVKRGLKFRRGRHTAAHDNKQRTARRAEPGMTLVAEPSLSDFQWAKEDDRQTH